MPRKVEEAVFKALSHPIRRKIVHTIGKNGYASFTDLSKIEPRVGLLYYHLNIMKDLLYQDEKKRYRLSEVGKKAYELLISGEDLEDYEDYSSTRHDTSSLLSSVLVPTILFETLFKVPHKSLFGTVFLISGIGLILSSVKFVPLFLFLVPMEVAFIPILVLTYLNWLVVSLLSYILLHVIYRKGDLKTFIGILVASAIAQLPLVLFPITWQLFPMIRNFKEVSMFLLLLFQSWGLWIFTIGIKVCVPLSTRRAVLIPLLIQYMGAVILLYGFRPL